MNQLMKDLTRDHKGLCQLLELLQTKLTMIEQGLPPDYTLISDAINYIESYVRRYHHPKEDIIYHYIIEQQLDDKEHFIQSCQEHQQFEPITEKLKASLQSILLDVVVSKETFISHLNAFIDAERSHVQNEEKLIFPLIEKLLTQDDWQEILPNIPIQEDDPLFGKNVLSEYHDLYVRLNE